MSLLNDNEVDIMAMRNIEIHEMGKNLKHLEIRFSNIPRNIDLLTNIFSVRKVKPYHLAMRVKPL